MPDGRTGTWIVAKVGTVKDPLLRAMLWGAVWDTVRDVRSAPARYIALLPLHLSGETNEQISRMILSRGAIARDDYLPNDASASLRTCWKQALLTRIDDPNLGYDLRKDAPDRLIAIAWTPPTLARLRDLLAGRATLVGAAIREPARWAIVRRLIAVGAPESGGSPSPVIGTPQARRGGTIAPLRAIEARAPIACSASAM